MIDVENMVFNAVATALRTEYPNMSIYGEYIENPASFPCVTLVEENNVTYRNSLTEDHRENHARLEYVANVYSNKQNGKKAEAKHISDIIDNTLQDLNFVRLMRSQVPNTDRTIYRITLRYEAVVDKGITTTETVEGEEVSTTTYTLYRE